jgi:hypothetical protein
VENGGVEEEQRRPWSSHGGHGCSSHAVAKVDDAESMSERGAEGSSASASGGGRSGAGSLGLTLQAAASRARGSNGDRTLCMTATFPARVVH